MKYSIEQLESAKKEDEIIKTSVTMATNTDRYARMLKYNNDIDFLLSNKINFDANQDQFYLLLNNKFYFYTSSNRWKVKGKQTYYRARSIEEVVAKL